MQFNSKKDKKKKSWLINKDDSVDCLSNNVYNIE